MSTQTATQLTRKELKQHVKEFYQNIAADGLPFHLKMFCMATFNADGDCQSDEFLHAQLRASLGRWESSFNPELSTEEQAAFLTASKGRTNDATVTQLTQRAATLKALCDLADSGLVGWEPLTWALSVQEAA